jgi:hypothetical protein
MSGTTWRGVSHSAQNREAPPSPNCVRHPSWRDNGLFERQAEISREDLLSAIASLRESTLAGSRRNGSAGFQTAPSEVAI